MRLFRRGSSAPITMMFGAVAIVIALLMFAIAAQALIGGYERRAHGIEVRAREVKRGLDAEICLYQRVENQTLVNETLITLTNSWPDEVRVDYFAAISKGGGILYESPLNITLGPGDSITLKPSELGLPSKYDGDFWLMKREVAYLQFHVSGRGMASTHPSIWRMENATGIELVNKTRTVVSTTTLTTTEIITTGGEVIPDYPVMGIIIQTSCVSDDCDYWYVDDECYEDCKRCVERCVACSGESTCKKFIWSSCARPSGSISRLPYCLCDEKWRENGCWYCKGRCEPDYCDQSFVDCMYGCILVQPYGCVPECIRNCTSSEYVGKSDPCHDYCEKWKECEVRVNVTVYLLNPEGGGVYPYKLPVELALYRIHHKPYLRDGLDPLYYCYKGVEELDRTKFIYDPSKGIFNWSTTIEGDAARYYPDNKNAVAAIAGVSIEGKRVYLDYYHICIGKYCHIRNEWRCVGRYDTATWTELPDCGGSEGGGFIIVPG